jgi:hypothetical protein
MGGARKDGRLLHGPRAGIVPDMARDSTSTAFSLLRTANFDARPVNQGTRHVLPKDLPKAIMHLTDEELARLLAATIAETERRGGITPPRGKPEPSFSLTRGQLNAVRAAFKVGITPARSAAVRLKPIGRAEGAGDHPLK